VRAKEQAPEPVRFPARHALKRQAFLRRVAGLSAPRGAADRSPATPPGERCGRRQPRRPLWPAAGAAAAPVSDKICS
jgi:hypothetical protein